MKRVIYYDSSRNNSIFCKGKNVVWHIIDMILYLQKAKMRRNRLFNIAIVTMFSNNTSIPSHYAIQSRE